MNVQNFFKQRHSYLHQNFLPGLKNNLPDIAFRRRPAEGTQPIIWLLWHMARVEDMGLSRLVWDKPQLYDEEWRSKMNTEITHYGTSMTDEEVRQFADKVNVHAVLDYQLEVGKRTIRELDHFDLNRLDEVLDEASVMRVVRDEGMASEKAQWVAKYYIGQPKGWVLCHMGLTHNFRHFGQVVMIRKMLGYG